MLVLKRRRGESVIINERIRIFVIDTKDGGVQLGFEAPETDKIRRLELPPFEESLVQSTAMALQVPK